MRARSVLELTMRTRLIAGVLLVGSAALPSLALPTKHDAAFRSLPPHRLPQGGVAGGCGGTTLTQSTDPNLIQGDASVFCDVGLASAENWVARSFGPLPASTAVSCIQFGIDENIGGDWPVEVLLLTGTLEGPDDLTTVFSITTNIPAGAKGLSISVFGFAPVEIAAAANLVVALRSPTRVPAQGGDGGALVFGFNSAGESAPTYIKAATCGVDDFVTTAEVGFPNSQLVMTIGLESTGPASCGSPGDCFTAHASPGCQEPLCCATVCATDPACCDVAWDSTCVGLAESGCGGVLVNGQWHVPSIPGTTLEEGPDGVTVRPSVPDASFGWSVDVFDLSDDPAGRPTGLQSSAISWNANEVGAEVRFSFSSGFGNNPDNLCFATVKPGVARLDFEGGAGSCFAADPGDLVDIVVLKGGQYVGTIPDQASGTVTIDIDPGGGGGTPDAKFTFWGFCKGNKKTTTTTNPDGSTSTTTETTWTYGFGGGSSSADNALLISGSAGTLVGDAFEIRPTSPRMCAAPLMTVCTGKHISKCLILMSQEDDVANSAQVVFSDADTAPRPEGTNVVSYTIGVGAAPLSGTAPSRMKPKKKGDLIGIELSDFGATPDGVALLLGGAESADFDLELEPLPGSIGACASFSTKLLGGGFGGTVLLDPCFACPPPFKGTWNIVPDFAGLGIGTYTVVGYLEGTALFAMPGMSGSAGSTDEPPASFGKLGGATPCYVFKWRPPTWFYPPFSDGPVQIDEIRVLAEGAPSPQPPIEHIEVRGTNLQSMMIGNPVVELPSKKPCPGDLNGNGAVSATDLSILLGGWGTPAADIDGNGTTDAADLAILLGSWGPCL